MRKWYPSEARALVHRWTSRWFAGLPIWRYLGHIIIYVIVISRALCLEPVLYKEKGPPFFRRFSGSTSPLNLTPLCNVQNAQGPFEASWPLLLPPRAHLPIFLLILFIFFIVSTTIQEMKVWGPCSKVVRILILQQQSIKGSTGPPELKALCNCTGCVAMKLALPSF